MRTAAMEITWQGREDARVNNGSVKMGRQKGERAKEVLDQEKGGRERGRGRRGGDRRGGVGRRWWRWKMRAKWKRMTTARRTKR
jgi:hypothetical protein